MTDLMKPALICVALVGIPAMAFAVSPGDTAGTTEAEIRAHLEAQGAEVVEIETEDGEIEVEYLLSGVKYEAEIDAETGAILEVELEDDQDDGDDEDEHGEDDDA